MKGKLVALMVLLTGVAFAQAGCKQCACNKPAKKVEKKAQKADNCRTCRKGCCSGGNCKL